MSAQREPVECCICMDAINFATNNCVTPCGHTFCFQCLAKALEQNNTCPCCRAVLMEVPEDEEASEWSEWTDEDEEEDEELYDDEALVSFRMLYQRLDGEDVEEEAVEDDEQVSNADETETVDDEEEDDDDAPLAEVEEITAKLQSRGITMLDLVAMLTVRKSANVAKHTDRFINALDSILDNAITDCDREAKEAAQIQDAHITEETK
uniref:RING-type domain-containing protein n=1 Tax=viral metagenome TaxID=1070528 RepID=A0A6C0K2X1_9ZZZZ